MYDCGSSSTSDSGARVAYALNSMGITKIDGLILSHPDYDHISGVPSLLAQVEVAEIIVGKKADYKDLLMILPKFR